MLLVPSATRVECTDTGADDLLRRLAALLPDAWIVAGAVTAKPVSDTGRRGYTRPFDAIVIGDRMVFVLDIWSLAGPTANRQKSGLFARFHDESIPDDVWKSFRREIEKLKALLHDRFEVEPGRVTPEKIWIRAQRFDSAEAAAAADTAELRRFARAATRQDRAAMFAPLQRKAVDRIATFLTDDAPTAPKPTELFFTDGATPTVVARTPTAPAASARSMEASRPAAPAVDAALPVVAKAAEAARTAPARPSHATQDELLLQQEAQIAPPAAPAPISAPEEAVRKASPRLDAALPVVAEAVEAAAAPVRPSQPATAEVSPPPSPPAPAPLARPGKAPAPAPRRKDAGAPLVPDAARSAAARPADGNASSDRAPPAAPALSEPPGKVSGPTPATIAVAAPLIASAAEAPVAHYAIDADSPLGQAPPPVALAPAQWRLAAHWKWLAALLLLLLVSQAATIGWLALFDRASPHREPAPPAAPAPAADAPAREPFVVRSLPASEPMRVGDQTATLRAGPSPDFPAVAWLDGGTRVVASGRADGPGGSSWIEIASANGAVGFVPDNMVQPELGPAPTIENAALPEQAPPPKIKRAAVESVTAPKLASAPKIKRAVAPKQAPAPKIKRAAASKQTPAPKIKRAGPAQSSREQAVTAPPGVTCILPGGEEIQATRSDCRAHSGIIYQ